MNYKGKIENGECICEGTPPQKKYMKGKRKRYKTQKVWSKALKSRGGFVVPYKPSAPKIGNIEKFITEVAENSARAKGMSEGFKVLKNARNKVTFKLGAKIGGFTTPPGGGVMDSGDDTPYTVYDKVKRQSGVNNTFDSKLYTHTFSAGRNMTKTVRQLARQNGTTKVVKWDTLRDIQNVINRANLSSFTGFNQKIQSFIHSDNFGWNQEDLMPLFDLGAVNSSHNKNQVLYGLVTNLMSQVKVTNVNKYLPVNVKLHLIKSKNFGKDNYELFNELHNGTNLTLQLQGAMPRMNQLLEASHNTNNVINSVWVDPSSRGIFGADNFKAQAEIVHTVSKRLHTGDTLQLTYNQYTGAGVRLDKLMGQEFSSSIDPQHPFTYFIGIEAYGPQVEGVNSNTPTARYLGTGPGALSFEFKKAIEGVVDNESVNDVVNTGPSKGVIATHFAIRRYTTMQTESTTTRKFNVAYDKIVNTIGGNSDEIYIPVMSDKYVGAAGDKA